MSTYYTNRIKQPKAPPVRYIPQPKYIGGDPEVIGYLRQAGLSDMNPLIFDSYHNKMLLRFATDAYANSLITKKEIIDTIYILISVLPAIVCSPYIVEQDSLHQRIYRNQDHIQKIFSSLKGNQEPSIVFLGIFASLRASKALGYEKVKPTYLLGWVLDIIRFTEVMSEVEEIPSLTNDLKVKEYSCPIWYTQYFKMKAFVANYPQKVKNKIAKQKELFQ